MSTIVSDRNGLTIVTQVFPQQNAPASAGSAINSLEKFTKGEPKLLGAAQIMAGLITLQLCIVLTVSVQRYDLISVHSAFVFWGPFIYINTGALSIIGGKKLYKNVIKASLAMNVFSAVTAAIAVLLLSMDLHPYNYYYGYYSCDYGRNHSFSGYECANLLIGVIGMQLVSSLLQFILSVCISALAFKATCCTEPMEMQGMSMQTTNAVPLPDTSHNDLEEAIYHDVYNQHAGHANELQNKEETYEEYKYEQTI